MIGRGRRRARAVAAALATCVVAACGSSGDAGAAPTLTWYVGPDRVDANALAATCTDQADGAYRIRVEQLPDDVTARHDLLVRRLRAGDSLDVLSVDSASTAELAAAGYLHAVPDATAAELGAGIAPKALAAATYRDRLVVAPWFMDPQVLWFRGNLAERAGLDTSKPISWDDLLAGAQRLGVTVQVADPDGGGTAAWVDALVAGAGGQVLTGDGRDAKVGLSGDAGRAAASVVELYGQSDVGPGPSRDALSAFASPDGGFLLASAAAIADPALAAVSSDMTAAPYPAVVDTSVAPLAGVGLGVAEHAAHPDESFAAIACLTSPAVLTRLMADGQHAASRLSTFGVKEVKAAYPQAAVVRSSLESGVTAPVTPYWFQALRAIDATWQPTADVTQDATPDRSQAAVAAAVQGKLR